MTRDIEKLTLELWYKHANEACMNARNSTAIRGVDTLGEPELIEVSDMLSEIEGHISNNCALSQRCLNAMRNLTLRDGDKGYYKKIRKKLVKRVNPLVSSEGYTREILQILESIVESQQSYIGDYLGLNREPSTQMDGCTCAGCGSNY